MFEIKLTIGLNAETMGLVSKLLSGGEATPTKGGKVTEALPEGVKISSEGKSNGVVKADKQEAKVNGQKEIKKEVNTETAVLTFEEVRAKIAAKKQEINDAAPIKKLLQSFGVDRATDLSADSYVAFVTQLETLKAA